MMKRFVLLALTLTLVACSRPSLPGVYSTTGSETKFRMMLTVQDGGQAVLATKSNLGNTQLDRSVEAVMAMPAARWTSEKGQLILQGARGDGKTVTERFAIQDNGDLIWLQNGARFVRQK